MKRKKRILVTGATGFIGSHLTRRLVSLGLDVHILARSDSNFWRIIDIVPKINIHILDLNEHAKVKRQVLSLKPDIVYHLAACGADYNKQDPQLLFKTNVNATISLLEAVGHYRVLKYVSAGSCFEYGDVSGRIREDTPLNPINVYGASKAAQTTVTLIMAKRLGIPYIVCRPFGIYGPHASLNQIVSCLFTSILDKKAIRLTGGSQIRDYTYVEDAVEAFIKAGLSTVAGRIVNICSGRPIKLKQLAKNAVKATGEKPKIEWGAIPYRHDEMWSLIGDNTCAKRLLGWEIKMPLERGLKNTYEWFKENRKFYLNK